MGLFSSIKKVVSKVAAPVGAFFGGPVGGAIGAGVSAALGPGISSALSYKGASERNDEQVALSREQMNFQKDMT